MNTGRTHFKKGYTPWNKGVHLSAEHRKKLSEAKTGFIPWNKGLYGVNAGDKNPNWKGGSSYIYSLRRTSQYSNWRSEIFKRDRYVCQTCGFDGSSGYLTAHHIKSLSHFPDLAFDINNGVTLCEPCHSQTDNYKGRGRGVN